MYLLFYQISRFMKVKVILVPLFGIPGSGKGSVMANLKKMAKESEKISIITVEMGAYFRAKAKTDGPIKDIMDSGGLISNSVVNDVFVELLNSSIAAPLLHGDELKEKMVVLLDGYPRTIPQWEYFLEYRSQNNMSVAGVFLELDEAVVLHRSTIRRICPKCGGTFSAEEFKICPHCKESEGVRRADDLKMKHRIAVFNEETSPVIQEAQAIIERQVIVSGADTLVASQQIWEFFQTL